MTRAVGDIPGWWWLEATTTTTTIETGAQHYCVITPPSCHEAFIPSHYTLTSPRYSVTVLPLSEYSASPAFKSNRIYTWTHTVTVWVSSLYLCLIYWHRSVRPRLRPEGDTQPPLISCSYNISGEMHFLGSRSVGPELSIAAFWDLSWDRGRRWVDALNFSFILFPLLLHTPPHRSRHSAANSHLLILIHRETDVKAQAKLAKFKYSVYIPLD